MRSYVLDLTLTPSDEISKHELGAMLEANNVGPNCQTTLHLINIP